MRSRATVVTAVAALLVSVALPARLMAQPTDFEFASDCFIVKVHEGVIPIVLPNGSVSFTFEPDAQQLPQAALAEPLIADLLNGFGATAIEPIIQFELRAEFLAIAQQSGVLREYTVDVPVGTDILLMTELLSLFVTHVEYAIPNWYGELYQTADPLFDDQWPLHNTGQPLNFPCPPPPQGCGPCGNGVGQMGTPDSDIDAPEAWEMETGSSDVVVAVIDTGADLDHEDLDGKLVSGRNFAKGECPESCELQGPGHPCPDDPCDPRNHGTWVSGIVGAAANNGKGIAGVSHGSLIMPLRVRQNIPLDEARAALTWATNEEDVRIINMSWGVKAGSLNDQIADAVL
ncbi:MAG: S8 family peptidase, partial [Planctomycetota bacterium]